MGWTNRGKFRAQAAIWRGATLPTNFFVALVTDTYEPTVDTDVMAALEEIAAGNGYTSGGISLDRNATDFDVLTEDDTNDLALVEIKDLVWTASSGPIPASGGDARYAVITDDDGTVADREVWAWWDLGGDTSVADGNPLTLEALTIRLTLPA